MFLIKAKRKVRYPGESEVSQLGWHPTETISSTAFPIRNIIKKKGKLCTIEGGLGQDLPKEK